MSARRFVVALAALLLLMAVPLYGAKKSKAEKAAKGYEKLFTQYLQEARSLKESPQEQAIGWMSDLASDPRAHKVNDLLTVNVVENISATGSANSTVNKQSSGSAGVPNLFGLERHLGFLDPANLVNSSATTKYQGGGTTTRAGALTADMTVRVAEVLPNGNLVLEGAREIDINGDREVIVLTGVVRPTDISMANTVQSTSIAQLQIRYFGQGLMTDSLQPGLLIRILNKIF
ncbi:MAG TPA: flagellar basal body L-ring protein FlgH [Vicinamibacterales bacterium]|nr:flagellar basal body L-ring protein FlgH [Vicinamibacterales bacterium]